jgi:hypothetical protein
LKVAQSQSVSFPHFFLFLFLLGYENAWINHPDHPDHVGIPHWVDDPRTMKLLVDRVKSGWLQPGWQYADPSQFIHTTEIYGIADTEMGADEHDVTYDRVNTGNDYDWEAHNHGFRPTRPNTMQ